MTSKEQLLKDLNYCKDSLERLISYADKQKEKWSTVTNYTAISNDIIKLRRELNEIRANLNQVE